MIGSSSHCLYLAEPAKSNRLEIAIVGTVYADSLCKRAEKQCHGDHLEKTQSRCSRRILAVPEEYLSLESLLESVICRDAWYSEMANQEC